MSILRAMSWAFSLPVGAGMLAGMLVGFRAARGAVIAHKDQDSSSCKSALKLLRKLWFRRWATSADANVAAPAPRLAVPRAAFASGPVARGYEQGLDHALPEPGPVP